MQKGFSTRGGAIIGPANTTWPFVKLIVSPDELVIIPSFKIVPTDTSEYVFPRDQVASLEKWIALPFVSWGIQINHHVPHIPQRIMFWSFENPDKLISKIHETGFLVTAYR